ncbi:MAG: hypothetical protein WDN31_11775 [Hyphomicrobium sp.]
MDHSVKILDIADVTHNVRRYRFEKPADYSFTPGQATDVSLDEDGWRDKKHPFTFTALTESRISSSPSRATSIPVRRCHRAALLLRPGPFAHRARRVGHHQPIVAPACSSPAARASPRSSPSCATCTTTGSWRG